VEGAWTAVASPNTIKMKQVNSKRTWNILIIVV
jgi:hypothetical protein